jgi:hypothetical protein
VDTQFLDRGLHDLAADVPVPAPPTDTLLHRGRRARRRRTVTTGLAGSACVLLVLAGVAVTVAAPSSTTDRRTDRRGPDVAATTPRLDPVAAVTATEQTSYTYTMNYRAVPIDGATRTPADEELQANYGGAGHDFVGAFDPATRTGFFRDTRPMGSERRLINGELYDGKGGEFFKMPGTYTGLRVGVPGMGDFSANPPELLRYLREQGSKITGTGGGKYRFEVVVPPAPREGNFPGGSAAISVTGTVTLTDDGRNVREIQFSSTHPEPQWVQATRIVVTYTMAGFGEPVTVERPAVR